jgi:hypothetical protein
MIHSVLRTPAWLAIAPAVSAPSGIAPSLNTCVLVETRPSSRAG